MAKPNANQIKQLIDTTENFAATVLCPMIEGMDIKPGTPNFVATLGATLNTAGTSAGGRITEYKKEDGFFKVISHGKYSNEEEEPNADPADDPDMKLAEATESLFRQCISLANSKNEAKANVAAVASTLFHVGSNVFGDDWVKASILTLVNDL